VAVPLVPARVPNQFTSVTSVANDKGYNEVKSGALNRSVIYLGQPQYRLIKAVIQSSPQMGYLTSK
jgi:hypothetical protein